MRNQETFGRRVMVTLIVLLALAAPGWSDGINDLDDAKTPFYANVFLGSGSGASLTTGYYNTGTGFESLNLNTTGAGNTANGWASLYANTTGDLNTGFGYGTLVFNTTGSRNVALGLLAGGENTTGSGNVFLGYEAENHLKYRTKSNRLVIANSPTKKPLLDGNFASKFLRINGAVKVNSLTEVSDVRLKTGITALEHALASVLALEGKSFNWRNGDEGIEALESDRRSIGFIAQEVEEVLPELV